MAAAHLAQIARWAVAFLLCGQVSTLETAFCLSGQDCTPFGYWTAPRFLVHLKWEFLKRLQISICRQIVVRLPVLLLSQDALNSFGVA